MSKLTSGGNWTPRSAVGNAMSYATPALAAYNGTIYMALKGHSDSNIWFMSYADGAGWTKQAQLPNFQTSAGPALATTTTGEVQMVWVGASDDDLYIASLNGGWNPDNPGHGWSEQIQIPVMRSSNQPALASQVLSTDQIPIAITGETSGSIYVAPTSSFALVSPAPKLSSNANYQFGDNGNALTGISIVIEMTEDFVLGSDGPAGPGLESFSGYSFQFNALSAPGYQVRIQQYIIELIGSQLQGTINNWPYNNTSTDWLVNNTISFANVTNSGVIPRNYKLYINLHHEKDGTVTGAEFSAYDNHMNLLGVTTNTINLPGGQIAPIVALEMNVVGPFNSQQVTISSGEGLLTFQSNNPLTASNPSLGATGEKSNINYQALTAYPYANDTEVRRRKTVVNKAAAGSGRTDS